MQRITGSVGLLVALAGCSLDGLLNSDQLPPDVSDPGLVLTPDGARAAYISTLSKFSRAFGGSSSTSFIVESGMLSDELVDINTTGNVVDQRTASASATSSAASGIYSNLQQVRGQASQAIGLLTDYLPDETALAAHLYAVQGYTEIFLAELFCSGIPLSTLDYKGDFTYRPGSTTEEVLAHAVALFDTALVLAGDSARLVDLARIGRGRALLGSGQYAASAASVASVSDGYGYRITYSTAQITPTSGMFFTNFAQTNLTGQTAGWRNLAIPEREGDNGMDWRTSGDPRTRVTLLNGSTIYHPDKYNTNGTTPLVLASGIEARLIEAEAALQSGSGAWLTTLNALRTDGAFDTTATSPPDTLWHAGSGGVAGLAPLEDPGSMSARVDLLFRERAFWLFLTGHRQGDLRRLLRQYGRQEGDLYPVGTYNNGVVPYGSDVMIPVPPAEKVSNPLYNGCASLGA